MSIINSQPRIGAAGQSTGFKIERSLRFNSADSAYLNRTFSTPTSNTSWSWSCWLKRSTLSAATFLLGTSSDCGFGFTSGDALRLWDNAGSTVATSTAVFRDPSAWYHIVFVSNGTTIKGYVNNAEYLSYTGTVTNLNSAAAHNIGRDPTGGGTFYLGGYLADVYFIDGSAKTPSDFGETDTDTGVWKPKAYSGSYGTNGFYLKFADNSGTTSTTLGKDSSGNGNNWTPNNFSVTAGAGNDSLVDTPTPYGTDTGAGGEVRGNYATLSPIASSFGFSGSGTPTISNGNLTVVSTAQNAHQYLAPFGLTSGKWYWEITLNSTPTELEIGVTGQPFTDSNSPFSTGEGALSWTAFPYGASGQVYNNNVAASGTFIASAVNGDVLRIAVDMDNGKIFWGKNGTWTNSADPAAGTGFSHSNLTGTVVPAFGQSGSGYSYSFDVNFGQRPFAYTAPSGFKALCTQNLPTPTIGATSATRANKYFDVVLRTSNGSAGGTYSTTVNMSNGAWMWDKGRSINSSHYLLDSVRGISKTLSSDTTGAEANYPNWFTNFGSSSFTTGSDDYTAGTTVVDWIWAANGSGSSNTQGSITSTVSANTTAGFSIVTYTGTGANATVGHGLGVAPSFIICKERNTAGYDWRCYHASLGATKYIDLNATAAAATASTIWQDTAPTTTVFSVGTNGSVNVNTGSFVAYCFAPVASYSSFGSYVGNGSSDGPMVFTGFRPRYVLLKRSDAAASWYVHDTVRDTYNQTTNSLYPNLSSAEDQGYLNLDILSNGFKIRTTTSNNASGGTYVYAAFAESPFKYSLAR